MNSPTKRLLVRNIYPGTQSDTLRKVFGKYGEITSVHIPQGVNNRGQSYAFVEFQTVREAETAFDVLNNTSLDGYV
jgi:multiple RNA-binding domain-containing protein 1